MPEVSTMTRAWAAGRVALVTGAGSGIGRASALAFARVGAAVAVADRDAASAEHTVRAIEAEGGRAIAIRCDVADPDEVGAMVATTIEQLGALDFAHNNAGIDAGTGTRLVDIERDTWDRVIAVNLSGVFHCMQAELSVMAPTRSGVIINTASIAGLRGMGKAAPYVAAKHGVVGLTRDAAVDYGALGIRVNAICPGVIETPMVEALTPAMLDALVKITPLRRRGQANEIAEMVIWLCSDAAAFVTGQAIAVDGGFTAH